MKHLVFLALALGIPGIGLAQMGPHGPELEGLDHGHLMMLMKIAKLTDEQRAQAHQVMKEAHEAVKPLVKQVHGLREQLAEKIVSPGTLQLSDLAPLRQQIRDLQIQIDDKALGAIIRIRGLLRPDQQQRVADAHAKMKALRAQMEEIAGPPDEMGEGEPGR
jgi:Spy/CpxP family protein refolding chaperone